MVKAQLTASLCVVALLACASSALAFHEPVGTNFGVAESHDSPSGGLGDDGLSVNAPAFPSFTPPGWPVPKAFWFGACDLDAADTSGSGTGTPPVIGPIHCIDHGKAYTMANAMNPDPPRETTWMPGQEPSWRFDSVEQAGAHPDVTVSMWMQRYPHSPSTEFGGTHQIGSDGDIRNVTIKLPPGFIGNPNALPRCPAEALRTTPTKCGPETQIGIATITLGEGGVNTTTGANTPPSDQRVPIWRSSCLARTSTSSAG
jgi:hypothetical protein